MSKPPTDPGDWSSASEALFRAARSDHAANAADRERVRSALARRLADASNAPSAGGRSPLEGVALATLAKIGLGIVVVVAALVTFMQLSDGSKPVDPKPAAATGSEAAKPPEHAPAPPPPVAASSELPTSAVAPAPSAAPTLAARRVGAPMRLRRGPEPKANRVPPAVAAPAAPAVEEVNHATAVDSPSPAATVPAARAPSPARDPAHVDDSSATRAQPKTDDDRADQPAAHTEVGSPQRAPASAELDPSDPRAELVFVGRMQAAMREQDPREVLALCAEHERRWPQGTFVQEREGLRAMASCQSDAHDATARVRRFVATYPRGPLAPRVRQACAEQLMAAERQKAP